MANQVEIRIQVDDGGSSTATASRFDSALASMTEQQQIATAEMIKNTHELGIQTQVETELMKAKYLDMFEKVRASGMLTASELQAVNTKIAGIKIAGNMNELNDAVKMTIPTMQKLAATEVTAAEAAALLKTGFDAAARGSFELSSEMGRMESMMIRMAIRGVMMGVAIGSIVNAYKDANLLSDEMRKSTDELHTSFIALREQTATALTPALEGLNTAAMYALEGMRALLAGYEAGTVNISAMAMKAGIVLKLLPDMMKGNGAEAAKQMTAQMGYVDEAAGSGLDKIYQTYLDRGKKLQEAMDVKKGGVSGGGLTEKDIGGGAQKALNEIEKEQLANRELILAVTKEYDSAMDATMSKEEQQAAQREAINQRLLQIYDKETAALMMKNLAVAQAQKQQEQYSISFYNNALKEYAVTKNIGDAMVAATKTAVAEKLKAIGQEEAVLAGKELWDGFGALARYDLPSAGNHFMSAAGHAANAALAGVAASAVSGGGGSGSGGAPSSAAQGGINSAANVQQQEQQKITHFYLPQDQDVFSRKWVVNFGLELNKAAQNGEFVFVNTQGAPIYA